MRSDKSLSEMTAYETIKVRIELGCQDCPFDGECEFPCKKTEVSND